MVGVPTYRPRENSEREKCSQRWESRRHLDERNGIARYMKVRFDLKTIFTRTFSSIASCMSRGKSMSKIIEGFTPIVLASHRNMAQKSTRQLI